MPRSRLIQRNERNQSNLDLICCYSANFFDKDSTFVTSTFPFHQHEFCFVDPCFKKKKLMIDEKKGGNPVGVICVCRSDEQSN